MIMINRINNLSQSEFIENFANIFEKTKWIADRLYDQKPFNSFEELCSKMLEIFKTAGKENQLKILRAHPDLANKINIGAPWMRNSRIGDVNCMYTGRNLHVSTS